MYNSFARIPSKVRDGNLMNKTYIIIITVVLLLASGYLFTIYTQSNTSGTYNNEPYVATLNDIPILLTHYKVYLRTTALHFENIAGENIWQTSWDGVSTTEIAKNQALESIIFVMLTNSMAPHIYLYEQDRELARTQAYEMFTTFTAEEQINFNIETIISVREDIINHEKVQEYLTQNYHQNVREMVFNEIFNNWRRDATIEINAEVWDSISL